MQEWQKKMEELTSATQQLMSALSSENFDQVRVADQHCHALRERYQVELVKDWSKDPNESHRQTAQRVTRQLQELTQICVQMARRLQDKISSDLGQLRHAQNVVEATKVNMNVPSSSINQDA